MRADLEDQGQGLRVFFSICDKWCCSQEEAQILLGITSSEIVQKCRLHPEQIKLTDDMVERIVYIMKIQGALQVLLHETESILVAEWVRMKNTDTLFRECSPMQKMLGGSIDDLHAVHQSLLSTLGLEEFIDEPS